MFLTLDKKTPGPYLKGNRRYGLSRIMRVVPPYTSPRLTTPGKTKLLGSSPNLVGMWVGMWGGVLLRQQVDVTLSLGAGQLGVNVPNHVNSP